MRNLLPFVAAMLLCGHSAAHADFTINFDDVPTGDSIDGFYSGGTSSSGASGANLGVFFDGWATTSGFGQTSEPNLAFLNEPYGIWDVTDINWTAMRFTAGFFSGGTLTVWSGPNGTGEVLATLTGVLGDPLDFQPYQLNWVGSARSFTASSDAGLDGQLGFDDVVFVTGGVPEPGSWALMIIGFGLVGTAVRSRVSVIAA